MARMKSDWAERSVLVTGADGFIASHLVEELLAQGARVVALVRRTSRTQVTGAYFNLRSCAGSAALRIVSVDLAGHSAAAELARVECDTWFHMAADAYVPASFSQPGAVVFNNVVSTLNVLEAARAARLRNVVIISSSEVYGTSPMAISEEFPLMPTTPYAASKVACDRLAWSYHQTFETPVTIVRPFNTYGPRHIYDVVPLFIRAALRNQPLTVHGTGEQTRDLTYVSDQVAALIAVGQRPGRGEVFNVGTGVDHAIRTVAEVIKAECQSACEIVFGPPRPGEVQKLQADASRVTSEVGWRPRVGLEEGIRRNVSWMREQLDRERAGAC